ncbi:histidine phosphatase superfamily [Phlyctochytrium arcticum]|nr:histidine phosphatase superfamily [Phlyctochytrium arcticum]
MPFPLPDEATLSQRYPPELKLKFLEIIHRHGERTPGNSYPHLQPPGTWSHCKVTPFLHALYQMGSDLQTEDRDSIDTPRHERPPNVQNIIYKDDITKMAAVASLKESADNGECSAGQLTDTGKSTMKTSGENLRKLYIDRMGLFEGKMDKDYHQHVYLRSTDYARTIESLQFLLHGLHPTSARQDESYANLTIHVKPFAEENMYPHPHCAALKVLSTEIRKRTWEDHKPQIDALLARLKHLDPKPTTTKSNFHQLYDLQDLFVCMQGHGVPLPKGVSQADVDELNYLVRSYAYNPYDMNDKLASLGIGRLVQDLRDRLQDAVYSRPGSVKLAIFSGHDSTVGPLLSAFKIKESQWPPLGSMVNIELFEENKLGSSWTRFLPFYKASNHYVRMIYNGQPLSIPACAPADRHRKDDPSLCTLETFLSEMERIIPQDYEGECKSIGAQAPAKAAPPSNPATPDR